MKRQGCIWIRQYASQNRRNTTAFFIDEEAVVNDVFSAVYKEEGQFIKKVKEDIKASKRTDNPPKQEQRETFEPDSKRPEVHLCIDRLSQREIEILSLLAKGMSNNEIAKTLYISTNTTQWHISHIYSKLGVKSRTQAILRAGELKIL